MNQEYSGPMPLVEYMRLIASEIPPSGIAELELALNSQGLVDDAGKQKIKISIGPGQVQVASKLEWKR